MPDTDPARPARVAVLDIGKTNVKLNVVATDGTLIETASCPNPVLPGPPYHHHDVAALEGWIFEHLAAFARRHPLAGLVTTGHGAGGVLVGETALAAPMIDYEQPCPEPVTALYRTLAGTYAERGSAILHGATHTARQILWLETEYPDLFAAGRAFLAVPQYWAWLFSGVAASEYTSIAAQSHLWDVANGRPGPIVAARGWERLLPPFVPAFAPVGRLRPDLAARLGLPEAFEIFCGVHDSSVNFYRYQAAGLKDFTLVSTGTWIVGLSDACPVSALREDLGMTMNADVHGRPVAGALTMGGREFALIAGPAREGEVAASDPALLARLVADGILALPSFGDEDGLVPGSARRGRIVAADGAEPVLSAAERRALAVLYTALLTDLMLDALRAEGLIVLDGSFVRDPAFAALIAAFRPDADVRFNLDTYGVASGAALLTGHRDRTAPAALALETPAPLALPGLAAYRAAWRAAAADARAPSIPSVPETSA